MFGRLLASLRGQPSAQAGFAPPAPAEPFYAVGDVHGCSALLRDLLARFDPGVPVVMVGDYVDRGEDSRGVLDLLMTRPGTTCLRGNHEQMLIDYLVRPEDAGGRFLRNGGMQTLASFGIGGVQPTSEAALLAAKAEDLREAMGQPTIDWLTALPCQIVSGNVAVVHAGADPAVPMDLQAPRNLIWGHRDFAAKARTDGLWIVHGHTIVPAVDIAPGRIAIDTGAYATGRLSAVLVAEGGASVLHT